MPKVSYKTKVLKKSIWEILFISSKKLFYVTRNFMRREGFFDIVFYIFDK